MLKLVNYIHETRALKNTINCFVIFYWTQLKKNILNKDNTNTKEKLYIAICWIYQVSLLKKMLSVEYWDLKL